MIERKSDPEPPRVYVTLPGGRQVAGRLLRWRQDKNGRWWAEIATYTPASAVAKIDGEQYDDVPRESATPPTAGAADYVLAADTRQHPPTAEIHRTDCWSLAKPAQWIRLTPMPTAKDARDMLRFDGTTACTLCNPQP